MYVCLLMRKIEVAPCLSVRKQVVDYWLLLESPSSLIRIHCHLLLVDVVFNALLELFTLRDRFCILVDQGRVHFVHRGARLVRLVAPVDLELIRQQLRVVAVFAENFVVLDALERLLVVHLNALTLLFKPHVVEVHVLLAHVGRAVPVAHSVDFDVWLATEGALAHPSLAQVVVILLVVRFLLIPQERRDSCTFPQVHAHSRLPLGTLVTKFQRDLLGLQRVNFGPRLGPLGVNLHISRHRRLLGNLPQFEGFLALVRLYDLFEDLLLTVEPSADFSLNLRQGEIALVHMRLAQVLVD